MPLSGQDGSTAIMLATFKENEEMMKVLLGLDADYSRKIRGKPANPDIRDVKGHAALHFAVSSKTASLVSILKVSEADTDIPTNDGRTPLMVAVESKNEHVAREILRGGLNMKLRDNCGRRAWGYAQDSAVPVDIRIALSRAAGDGLQSI